MSNNAAPAQAAEGSHPSPSTDTPADKSAMETDSLNYDPEMIARYIHFYKTGRDINKPNPNDANSDKPINPPKKKQKKKNIPPEVLETRRIIQLCCRDNNLPRALEAFHKALRGLVRIEAQTFYQALNLCEGTFSERTGVHVGTPKNQKKGDHNDNGETRKVTKISLNQRLHHANQIYILLSSLSIPLIDQAFTALVRLSSRAGDFERAEKYLDEAEQTQQCKVKLRIYSSLLRAYCNELTIEGGSDETIECIAPTQKRLIQALTVWKRMYENSGTLSTGHPNYVNAKKACENGELFGEGISPKITPTELEYTALMNCATTLHDVPLMERLLSDVADQTLVPGAAATEAMLNWFRSDVGDSASAQGVGSALDHVTLPPREDPSLGSLTNRNGKGWKIHRSCCVDLATGKLTLSNPECKETNKEEASDDKTQYQLKPVELTDRAWNAMRDMNSAIVLEGQVVGNVSQFQGGGKGKKRGRGNNGNAANNQKQNNGRGKPQINSQGNNENDKSQWRIKAWKKFESYIQDHPSYNVVIDGANVGYYEQNFSNAPKHIDYQQIDWLLRHLLKQPSDNDHHIILFLHERHFSHRLAPPWAGQLIESWDSDKAPYNRLTVYRTPGGMNDDWFWMHAALINGGKEGSTPPVLAISNDEMRDHHFQMLAQGSFLRWKERHQVHFDFGPWNKDLRRREALLKYPNIYSRRIQRVDCDGVDGGEAFVVPLPKKGDEGRFADGLHVVEDDVPSNETYIIIQRVI